MSHKNFRVQRAETGPYSPPMVLASFNDRELARIDYDTRLKQLTGSQFLELIDFAGDEVLVASAEVVD